MPPKRSPYSRQATLRTIVAAVLALAAGLFLILIAEYWSRSNAYPLGRAFANNIGSLLIATVALGTLWELVAKRALLSEILEEAARAEAIQASGITDVSDSWYTDIPWQQMFRSVHHLDIFFAYGATWRGSFAEEVRLLANRGRHRVRVVLPDPDNDDVVRTLAARFGGKPLEEVRAKICEAKDDFIHMFHTDPHPGFKYEIWYLPRDPLFSFYRFDDTAILSLYKHRGGRGGVPTIILKRGGSLFEFVYAEFAAFVDGERALARKVASSDDSDPTTANNGGG